MIDKLLQLDSQDKLKQRKVQVTSCVCCSTSVQYQFQENTSSFRDIMLSSCFTTTWYWFLQC